jgi:Tfp pilus assembly protein PilO
MDLATPGATKAVGTLALLAVAGLGWLVVVGPETDSLTQTREQITTVRDQNMVLTSQLAVLERQRDGLAETRRDARKLAELFPPTADQPGMFEAVTTAAVDAGIGPQGVTTLTPTPPVLATTGTDATAPATDPAADPATAPAATAQLVARQTVTLAVTGTYEQTQRLLENLEHMSRAYLVTAVSLASGSEGGEFTTTITGDMFVMPPVTDPGKTLNLSSTTRPEG